MKIIPISFHISNDDLIKSSADDVEQTIKDEVLEHITQAILPMLNNDTFVEMAPSEDASGFDVSINLIIGSAAEYIDATSATTTNLLELCMEQEIKHEDAADIISEATRPLIDLIK